MRIISLILGVAASAAIPLFILWLAIKAAERQYRSEEK